MKMFVVVLVATLVVNVASEVCTETELVYNGDFSLPAISTPWTIVGHLPGGHGTWSTVPQQNGYQLWEQGTMGAPTNGASGAPTGQSLEINGNSPWAEISYEFTTPSLTEANAQATYSFEYWYNPGCGCDSFSLFIEQQGQKIVSETYERETEKWVLSTGTFAFKSGQPLKITFTSNKRGDAGIHIDNVSLKAAICSDVEQVTGGSFETPVISNSWEKVSQIPGGEGYWSTTSVFMLWKEGAMGIPATDSTGKPVGQTLELNAGTTKAQVSYKFFAPYMLGTAESTLSFQYFIRESGEVCECSKVNYFGYSVEQGGKVLKTEALTAGGSGWNPVSVNLALEPKMPAHLHFTTDTQTEGGVHIDAVSVTLAESRDEDTDVRDTYDAQALQLTTGKTCC
eukprot:TRINITY_DN219_c0_g1_i5.p1 TRINITY_DN219_c0_g1~~TRINITY_DN219_c0_g1_i5.p1  ORF type:complete len:397 (+),score=70.78 TRINITY_DN219_c0_g1_i5:175-1365(+)